MSKIYKAFIENERALRHVFARYFRRPEDIEDMVQETFLKVFSAHMKEEIQEPRRFMLRVAKNLALSEIKKKAHTTTDWVEDSGGSEVYPDEGQLSAEDVLDGRQKFLVFMRAAAQLSAEQREALVMRKVENLPFKEIAVRLNVSLSTVEKRVAVALVKCAAYLQAEGYDPMEFGGPLPAADARDKKAVKQTYPHAGGGEG